MNKFVIFILAAVFLVSCKKESSDAISVSASSIGESYTETGLPVQKPVTYAVDANIGGYLEALPAHYTSHTTLRYPVIIFLHGQGEVGNGSQSSLPIVADNSIPHLISTQKFPANF